MPNKIYPNLMVESVEETVKYYMDVLGFNLTMAVSSGDKAVLFEMKGGKTYDFAIVNKGAIEIMFQERNSLVEDIPGFSATMPLGGSMALYFELDSLNAFYDEIKDNVNIVQEPIETWYGRNEFYMADNNGYILGFSDNSTP